MLQIQKLGGDLFGPIDLKIGAGECVTIRGPSGAGKSLLLRAIVDLDPSDGDVRWDGQSRDDLPAPEWRRLVGLVPAESGWWADRVREHFDPRSDVEHLFDAVGLPRDAMDWDVQRLSTGERHRLAIVRTIAVQPKVLLLDEPTAALDGDATAQVERLLRKQQNAGVAMLVVTHDPEQSRRIASRGLVMEGGRLRSVAGDCP